MILLSKICKKQIKPHHQGLGNVLCTAERQPQSKLFKNILICNSILFLTVLLSFKSFSITSINISFCSGSRLEGKIKILFTHLVRHTQNLKRIGLLTFRHKLGTKSIEETTPRKIKYSKELIVKELDWKWS